MDQRIAATTAGVSLLVMAAAAAFSYGAVHASLIVPGDAAATFERLVSADALFRAGLFGWFVILLCDIVATWALYWYLRPVHAGSALLAAWMRLAYAAVLGVAICCLAAVSLLTGSPAPGNPASLPTETAAALAALGLATFELVWSIGLIVFAAHLAVLGWTTLRTSRIPKFVGLLLLFAAAGYAVVHLGSAFLPQYGATVSLLEKAFSLPMIAGELALAGWLLFRGGEAVS